MVSMSRSTTVDAISPGEHVPTADQRIVMHGLSWTDFESFLALRGLDAPAPRVAYLEGTLELMSPSLDHETIKKRFGAVVEAYLDHLGIRYRALGSWLLKHAPTEAGIEPDESYILHELHKPRPDLALEVTWTSGGISKLEIYRRYGVPEVWFWKADVVSFFVLGADGYERRERSAAIPDFDSSFLSEMLVLEAHSDVTRELRKRFG